MDLKNKPYVMCKDYFKREFAKAKAQQMQALKKKSPKSKND